MIEEIEIIKRSLARKFHLKTEGKKGEVRIVGVVPDGDYLVRIKGRPYCVSIQNNALHDLKDMK